MAKAYPDIKNYYLNFTLLIYEVEHISCLVVICVSSLVNFWPLSLPVFLLEMYFSSYWFVHYLYLWGILIYFPLTCDLLLSKDVEKNHNWMYQKYFKFNFCNWAQHSFIMNWHLFNVFIYLSIISPSPNLKSYNLLNSFSLLSKKFFLYQPISRFCDFFLQNKFLSFPHLFLFPSVLTMSIFSLFSQSSAINLVSSMKIINFYLKWYLYNFGTDIRRGNTSCLNYFKNACFT